MQYSYNEFIVRCCIATTNLLHLLILNSIVWFFFVTGNISDTSFQGSLILLISLQYVYMAASENSDHQLPELLDLGGE
jgi:uncharacterized YccA/Bax inhibitor family protein